MPEPQEHSDMANQEQLTLYSANTFYQRLRGLLGRRQLGDNECLHITPCADVHSFGMSYPLDIVFLDGDGSVLDVKPLPPNRWTYCAGAKSVIEFRIGCANRHGFESPNNEEVRKQLHTINPNIFEIDTVVKKTIGERK